MNDGKICVSVCAGTADDFLRNIMQAANYADVVELRFDCLNDDAIRTVFENLPSIDKTYLFTFRPREQGGKRDLTLGQRLKFWQLAFWNPENDFMIDVESDPRIVLAINPDTVERIVSFHDFQQTPENLDSTWEMISEFSGDTVKIAVTAHDVTDSIAVWEMLSLARAKNKSIVPIAMGEAGKWTRILSLAHGAFMTYASLETGSETAPGQVTVMDLIETYRVKKLDVETKVYGVIGDPVSQSLSPFMHNPAFGASGLNAVFIPFLVKDIGAFMQRMVRPESREIELNFGGFAVTMPHKQSIMKYLDAVDPVAQEIGAVNTVKIENGKLTGFNTDAEGFIIPLKARFGGLSEARVAVFGAGGAARSCVYALKRECADVMIVARDGNRAKELAVEFGIQWSSISDFQSQIANPGFVPDIVVDTTPLGMNGALENESHFTADGLKGVKFVYDLVTKSSDTPILREARKAGVPAIGGIEMLIAQGAKQFEIWTGRSAPADLMRASVVGRMNKEVE